MLFLPIRPFLYDWMLGRCFQIPCWNVNVPHAELLLSFWLMPSDARAPVLPFPPLPGQVGLVADGLGTTAEAPVYRSQPQFPKPMSAESTSGRVGPLHPKQRHPIIILPCVSFPLPCTGSPPRQLFDASSRDQLASFSPVPATRLAAVTCLQVKVVLLAVDQSVSSRVLLCPQKPQKPLHRYSFAPGPVLWLGPLTGFRLNRPTVSVAFCYFHAVNGFPSELKDKVYLDAAGIQLRLPLEIPHLLIRMWLLNLCVACDGEWVSWRISLCYAACFCAGPP